MPQKRNLRFRIFHDSYKQQPFSRIELGKTVLLIDANAIYMRRQSYGYWRIRTTKSAAASRHAELNVHTAFHFKGKKLSVSYSIRRVSGPTGQHTKMKASYGADVIGDLQFYRGTIGAGSNGNRWPHLEGEDWKLVFHYEPATSASDGFFSIDHFEKNNTAKSFSTGESASSIHDKVLSAGIKNISADITDIIPEIGWELPLHGPGMPGGVLRCLRYTGYQQYKVDLYGKSTVEEWLLSMKPFIAKSTAHDVFEMLEWETPEKTQRGELWSPVRVYIPRE